MLSRFADRSAGAPRGRRARAALSFAIVALLCGGAAPAPQFDLLIVGGELIDGTGADPVRADLGVRGDRIVFVGDATAAGLKASRRIDASGRLDPFGRSVRISLRKLVR